MATTPPLNYASRQRSRLPRWVKRPAAMIVLLGIAAVAWRLGPHAWQFARIWYWERQCMNFGAPPGTAVSERLHPGSAKPPITWPFIDGDDPQFASLGDRLPIITKDSGPRPVLVSRQPICWLRFLQQSDNVTAEDTPTTLVFCHQRISPSGHVRLLTVEYPNREDLGDELARELIPYVYANASWNDNSPLPRRGWGIAWSGIALRGPTRIFAGQPDPADASHFTIEYEWPDGIHGILDGYLRDDDNFDIRIRPGPGDVASERNRVFHRPRRPTSP
jgi:hypothetical protein